MPLFTFNIDELKLTKSGKETKRLFAEGGARIDDEPANDPGQKFNAIDLAAPIKLSAGKKRHALVQLSGA